MATHSCITPQWSNSYTPQCRLDIAEQSANDNTMTLAWSLVYVAHNRAASTNGYGRQYTAIIDGKTVASGTFNINGIATEYLIKKGTTTVTRTKSARTINFSCSFTFDVTWAGVYGGTKSASGSFTVPQISSWKVSYNANGGSGAPGAQTKWYGETLKLSTVKPTRTGYSFQGWSTAKDNTVEYASGANYTANATVTLYAVWKAKTYKVTYNANGGSGAPAAQTKTYGVTLKLSTTKPTRTNYNFKGWGTSAGSTTVAYAAGANYTANAAITLYAIWELAYTPPRITNVKVDRCNEDGALNDEGRYVKVSFNWAADKSVQLITVGCKEGEDPQIFSKVTPPASGTSGSISVVTGGNALDPEREYIAAIVVNDEVGGNEIDTRIPAMEFIMDVRPHGVTFGGPATSDGFRVKYSAAFDNTIRFNDYIQGQIKHNDTGSKWVQGRDRAIIRNTQSKSDGWYPSVSGKTPTGSWEIGVYGEDLVFSFINDSDYNKDNNVTKRYILPKDQLWMDGIDLVNRQARTATNGQWFGIYDNGNARKGWIGHDGTTTLKLINEASTHLETNCHFIIPNQYGYYGKKTDGNDGLLIYASSGDNLIIGSSSNNSNSLGNIGLYAGKDVAFYAGRTKNQAAKVMRIFNETSGSLRTIFRCDVNGGGFLGTTTYRWNTGFFTNAITASDLKEKSIIDDFDFKIEEFIMGLTPIAYRRTGSGDTGQRVHMGFGAQHVAKLINQIDLGNMSIVNATITKEVEKTIVNDDGIEEKILERMEEPYNGTEEIDDSELSWGLNYNEFIAPIVLMLQKQQQEIIQLKRELHVLKERGKK